MSPSGLSGGGHGAESTPGLVMLEHSSIDNFKSKIPKTLVHLPKTSLLFFLLEQNKVSRSLYCVS